jgi:hypothetical protein
MATISEAGVWYFPVPPEVLTLNSRLSILTALALYRYHPGGTEEDEPTENAANKVALLKALKAIFDTPYRLRQKTDVMYELIGRDVIDDDDMVPRRLDWTQGEHPDRIVRQMGMRIGTTAARLARILCWHSTSS